MRYELITSEDLHFSTVKRIQYRIEVPDADDLEQLLTVAKELQAATLPVNAISFQFYGPAEVAQAAAENARAKKKNPEAEDLQVHELVLAAVTIDFAPEGDWSKADQVEAGDYETHRFSIRVNREGGD